MVKQTKRIYVLQSWHYPQRVFKGIRNSGEFPLDTIEKEAKYICNRFKW